MQDTWVSLETHAHHVLQHLVTETETLEKQLERLLEVQVHQQ